MELIPLDTVHGQVVVLISLQVLARVGSRAQMDIAFFSTDQEQVLLIFGEVEAHTTGETIHELLLVVGGEVFVVIDH